MKRLKGLGELPDFIDIYDGKFYEQNKDVYQIDIYGDTGMQQANLASLIPAGLQKILPLALGFMFLGALFGKVGK